MQILQKFFKLVDLSQSVPCLSPSIELKNKDLLMPVELEHGGSMDTYGAVYLDWSHVVCNPQNFLVLSILNLKAWF